MMNNKYKYSLGQFIMGQCMEWKLCMAAEVVHYGVRTECTRFSHGDEVVLLAFGRITNVSVI